VTIKNTPYYLDSEREAIYKFIELYLSKNRHILIVGDGTCGKTEYLTYLK
jgi:energy-coupling factor transporter ATP-binding protein EcfA2